jgi:hypothetical protein
MHAAILRTGDRAVNLRIYLRAQRACWMVGQRRAAAVNDEKLPGARSDAGAADAAPGLPLDPAYVAALYARIRHISGCIELRTAPVIEMTGGLHTRAQLTLDLNHPRERAAFEAALLALEDASP